MRQIALDTETTGVETKDGHRIVEIGCVELENRRITGNNFHCYLNPDREVEEGALKVHGLTNKFLADKPLFAQIEQEFLEFVSGAELIIHNAPFDIGFLDHELRLTSSSTRDMASHCTVLDTLVLARDKHPGQRNSLDALCRRYGVDNTHRELHGALLDAEILADVYLLMTSGQSSLLLNEDKVKVVSGGTVQREFDSNRPPLTVLKASPEELQQHQTRIDELEEKGANGALWNRI